MESNKRRSRRESRRDSVKSKEIVKDDVELDLSIDFDGINDELMESALMLKKYGDFVTSALRKRKAVALKKDEIEALTYAKLSAKGGMKVKELESHVTLSSDVQRLNRELLEAESQEDSLKRIYYAFKARHESIKELSANIRKEMLG